MPLESRYPSRFSLILMLSLWAVACTPTTTAEHQTEPLVTPKTSAPEVDSAAARIKSDKENAPSGVPAEVQTQEKTVGACERLDVCCKAWGARAADIQTTCAIHREGRAAELNQGRRDTECVRVLEAWSKVKSAPAECNIDI